MNTNICTSRAVLLIASASAEYTAARDELLKLSLDMAGALGELTRDLQSAAPIEGRLPDAQKLTGALAKVETLQANLYRLVKTYGVEDYIGEIFDDPFRWVATFKPAN